MEFRKANLDDLHHLIELRKQQQVAQGIEPKTDIDADLEKFFQKKLKEGSMVQWLAEVGGEIVACGAVIFYEFPPSYVNKSGKKAYITNVYTKEEYRGQGIAKELMEKLVDEVKKAGISNIWLGASEMGKPLYKKFGFQEVDEWMELHL